MKNKNVIIYTRVSTKEQADTGYSLTFQKEQLEKYCNFKNYSIIKHYEEDYSAKDFKSRPKYKEMRTYINANKKDVDAIVFLRWDRFSRNIEFAFREIRLLKEMGVELECMEQPIDLSIPENLSMLSMYLALPEIENTKISNRVKNGMIKAAQLDCYMDSSPIGYTNGREAIRHIQTTKVNKFINAIMQDHKRIQDKTKRLITISHNQSHIVNPVLMFSNLFIEDLNKLYLLKNNLIRYVG